MMAVFAIVALASAALGLQYLLALGDSPNRTESAGTRSLG
jgi:hypothetical protein